MLLPLALIGVSVVLALAMKGQGSTPPAVAPTILPPGTYTSVVADLDVSAAWLASTPMELQAALVKQGLSPNQIMITQIPATEPPPAGYTVIPAGVSPPSQQPVGSTAARVRIRFDAVPEGFVNEFFLGMTAAAGTGKATAVLRGVYVQDFRVPPAA